MGTLLIMSQVSSGTPRVVRIDHVIVGVTDWQVASEFYRRVLGAEVVELDDGRVLLQVRRHPGECSRPWCGPQCRCCPDPGETGHTDLCFHWSGSIGEAMAHLARHDVPIETGPVERPGALGKGTSVYFRDPDGSLIELISYVQGVPPADRHDIRRHHTRTKQAACQSGR